MRPDPALAATIAAVVEEGTLDAAARRLHVSPSAVSQRVKLAEDQLGRRLLVRSKPARPTEAGQVVVRYAQRLALLQQETADLLGAAGSARARLSIAVNADSLTAWAMPPIARFVAAHDVELDVRREDQDRTAALLEDGTVAAAVTSRETAVAGCLSHALGSLRFLPVAAPSWVERWGSDETGLGAGPRIDYDQSDTLQTRWLASRDVDPARSPRHLVPSTRAITRAVLLGMGWAMLPEDQAQRLVDDGRAVALGDDGARMPLWWQAWKQHSSALDELTTELLTEARRHLAPPQASPRRRDS